MSSSRGSAHHLPEGRFAVPDPDDPARMTYWRVEATTASGSKKELRPWPADVRWAPWRPDYPEGLGPEERRAWSQTWYDDVYFGWKDAVIAAIAADPQAAADEFARSAPAAELPAPVRKRPRQRVRPRPVSAKQREIAAQRLMAEALRRVGMSERQVAAELDLPKTTARRRLSGGQRVADELSRVMLEMRVSQLLEQLVPLARSATADDLPRLLAQIERVKRMQVLAAGGSVPPVPEAGSLDVFGPSPAGDGR